LRLAAVIGAASGEVAQNAVSLGQPLATLAGVRLLFRCRVDEPIGVIFRDLPAIGALDLVE
jgi:hypothetical protein